MTREKGALVAPVRRTLPKGQRLTRRADQEISVVLIDKILTNNKTCSAQLSRAITTGFDPYYIGEFMLTQNKPQIQAPQVWDKPTALAQVGDYIRVAPVMQVVERKSLSNGRVWFLVKPSNASADPEEWVVEAELSTKEQQQPEQEPQPVGFAGDSVSVGLQPTREAIAEFEQGYIHGQRDAAERLHPMYAEASCQYSTGYLQGYNSTLNPPQPTTPQQQQWSITWNSQWNWYNAWVGDCYAGSCTKYEEAEQLAQKCIAAHKRWQEHREKVLAAYAG